jgi:pimeloyl-ACP methyl ester carboxylesterase
VVTHDYGGAVALRAHLLHKRGFDSLALIDVVALAPWGSAFFRLIKDNPAVFGSLPAAVHEGALRAYIAGASFHDLSGADMDALVGPWLGEVGQAAFYRQIAQADERYTDQVEPLYRDLRLPVLIGWGKEDTWIPVDRAETLASLIRGSQLKVLENAGHLIQLDQPVALAMLLQKWLLSQPSTQLNGGEGGLL